MRKRRSLFLNSKVEVEEGKGNTPSQEESLFGTTWSVNVNRREHYKILFSLDLDMEQGKGIFFRPELLNL